MPANLTPQYLAAEQRFKDAATQREKIEALEEMMAVIPKHKGTEKLQADLKRKMAKLQAEGEKKHAVSKVSALYAAPREGAGQVVLVGAPNVGKSSLLARLTKATPEIAEYPFTTRLPQPGMMPYENIQIQFVDMPPVAAEFYEPWMGGIVRQADLVLLVVDLSSDDLLEEAEGVIALLDHSKIKLVSTTDGNVGDELPGVVHSKTLVVANKCELPSSRENLAIFKEFYGSQFDMLCASTVTGEGLEDLRRRVFERLEIIRVFSKVPGKKADLSGAPFVLTAGSTVLDLARAIHRDFERTLKSAKIWSGEKSKRSVRYEGQRVERSHRLEDGDILELHV